MSCRSSFAAAGDPATGGAVVFGGLGECPTSLSSTLGDTWVYANGSWANRTGSLNASPSGRFFAQMAYDPSESAYLLFGGMNSSGVEPAGAWTFNATGWAPVPGSGQPPARIQAGLAYDPSGGEVVLFGGSPSEGAAAYDDDTWAYSGGHWTQLTPALSPPARRDPTMVTDPALGGVLLFGGVTPNGTALGDAWLFRGGGWTPLALPAPSPRWDASATYDPSLGSVVLFGGCTALGCGQSDSDTWLLNATGWTSVTTWVGPPPPSRGSAGMFFVPTSSTVLLVDGAGTTARLNDSWTLGPLLVVAANASLGPYDAGQTLSGSLGVVIGDAPVSGTITGLTGCTAAVPGAFSCPLAAPGSYPLGVSFLASDGAFVGLPLGTVNVSAALRLTLTSSPSSGQVPLDAQLRASLTGGSPPYVYTWTTPTGATSATGNVSVSIALPGSYQATVAVVDASGAAANATTALLAVPDLLVRLLGSLTHETCVGAIGQATFVVTANVSGGLGPFSYDWSGGGTATTEGLTLAAGSSKNVSVGVTDSVGDSAIASTNLTAPGVDCSTHLPGGAFGGPGLVLPLLLVAAVVVLVAVAALLLLRRRRHGVGPAPSARPPSPDGPAPASGVPEPTAGSGPSPLPAAPVALMPAAATAAAPLPEAPRPPAGSPRPMAPSIAEQVLDHLYRQGRLGPDETAPLAFTQEGIARGIGREQNVFAKTLARLEAAGLLVADVRHVQGSARRRKVYRLTPKGEQSATAARASTTRPQPPAAPPG